MTWKVDFKYTDFASDGSGTPIHVKARISNELGDVQNATLPLGSEKKSDEEIIELVQEEFYQRTYLNRAENEKFQKLEEAAERANKAAEQANEATEANKKAIDKAIFELTNLVNSMLASAFGGDEEATEEEENGTTDPTDQATEETDKQA